MHPRLVIAGTHSGVGKTTVSLALMAALTQRGRSVQAFKVGPDFIDPTHHRAVTGRPSRNLDGWMLGADINRHIFARAATGADLSIIEGMMGLYDGSSAVTETGSTAELAKQIDAPVLLVIDAAAMARSAAVMARGYATFDRALRVAGVLFNRVGSEGHYRLLKDAVEAETDLTVVGYLKGEASVTLPDRHLGLVTALEKASAEVYDRLAAVVRETLDLDRVEALAGSAGPLPRIPETGASAGAVERRVRIGLAHDPAFCFYYPDNLELLQAAGAELVPFSPIADRSLPKVDMLYLGGGYPELYGERLAANIVMRDAVRDFVQRGGMIYAECGGLMYLTRAIRDFEGRSHEMVGIFPAEAVMQKSSPTLGYRTVHCSRPCLLGEAGLHARGHEFHYSKLVPTGPLEYACALTDAQGRPQGCDGLIADRVIALYSHVHFASRPQIAASLVDAARLTPARTSASTGAWR
ncbi:MAG TPA: cobyrinate a,c-diamide synthase [Nitrospira sp.]|nr:cobyrinate a,c-diamide synthase [Nitrospira sp.]